MNIRFIHIFIILIITSYIAETVNANEDYQYALALMQERKEYNTAVSKFKEFIDNNPASEYTPRAIFYMASCLARLGKDTSAGNSYEQLIKLYPDTDKKLLLQANSYGADAYFRAEKYENAIELYKTILSRYPESKECETALYWSAEAYKRLFQQDSSNSEFYTCTINAYKKLEEKFPESRFLHDAQQSAGLLAFNNRQYATAIINFNKYLQNRELLTPEKEEFILYHLGESLFWQKQFTQADQSFKQLIDKFPESIYLAESYAGIGWCAYSMNDQLAAATHFAKSALLFTDNKKALNTHFDAAVAFTQANRPEKAIEEYRFIIKETSHPKLQQTLLNLGILLKATGDSDNLTEAEKLFKACREYSGADSKAEITIEAGTLLADIMINTKRYAEAEKIYRNIAEKYPENNSAAFALYQLALTQAKLQKYREASVSIKTLLKNHHASSLRLQAAYAIADYQNILGEKSKSMIAYKWLSTKAEEWAEKYLQSNSIENAELFLREAKEIAAAALLHLGESLYQAKDNAQAKMQAKDYFAEYINRFSDNPRVSAALLRLGELTEKDNLIIAQKYFQNAYANIQNLNNTTDDELRSIAMHAEYRLCLNLLLQARQENNKEQKNILFKTVKDNINTFITKYQNNKTAAKLLPQIMYYKAEADQFFDNNTDAHKNYLASYKADKNSVTADSALFSCALIEHQEDRKVQAEQKLQTLLRDYPKSRHYDNALLILAIYCRKDNNHKQALAYLNELTEEFPASEFYQTAQLEKAKILIDDDIHQEAKNILTTILNTGTEKDNIIPDSLYYLSVINAEQLDNTEIPAEEKTKLLNELKNILQRIITEYPDYSRNCSTKIRLAEINYKENEYTEAITWYQKALMHNSELNDKIHYRLAWCYKKLAETNPAFAEKSLNEFLQLCDNFPASSLFAESAIHAAKSLRENEEYDKALKLYTQIPNKTDDELLIMNALYGESLTQLLLKDYSSAFRNFKDYISRYPQSSLLHEANWGAGQAALMLGATADAADYFNAAKSDEYKGKVAAQARYGLGLIALGNNDYKLARDEFRKVDIFHQQWPEVAAASLLKAAEASRKLNEEETAVNDLKRIIQLYASTPSAKTAEEQLLTEVK